MKIGIIVHSQTGHTHEVALKIQEKFQATGHTVNVEQLTISGGVRPENPPDTGTYDALVFGAPVHAFTLSKGMEAYLKQIPSLQGKKVALFVTKGQRFLWTGGNQAISKMKKICESKGAIVCGTGIVVWNEEREKQTTDLVETMSRCFS
jgi:NAD(P)H dehydrogenase (quinone)